MNQNRLKVLKDFIGFCKAELNIQTLPKISLLNDKSFVEQNRSFGEYNPQTNAIRVVALNRNLADICRSLAHELCHHRQNELDMIYNTAGETGTDIENDAINRKPQPGMAFQAKEMFPSIDFNTSIMVGNRPSDMAFGRNAGLHTVFLATTHPETPFPDPSIDFRFDTLLELANALS